MNHDIANIWLNPLAVVDYGILWPIGLKAAQFDGSIISHTPLRRRICLNRNE